MGGEIRVISRRACVVVNDGTVGDVGGSEKVSTNDKLVQFVGECNGHVTCDHRIQRGVRLVKHLACQVHAHAESLGCQLHVSEVTIDVGESCDFCKFRSFNVWQ